MRKIALQLLFLVAFLIINFNFTSCVTIGTALFAPSDEELKVVESELGNHEGWYHPKTKEAHIKITLNNQEQKTGYFKRIMEAVTGTESLQFVQLKTDIRIENVPVNYIVSTEVLGAKKRKSKSKKLLIAAGIDIVYIGLFFVAAALSDESIIL